MSEKKFKTKLSVEDKMLLIKDLSARLPYALKVEHCSGFIGTLRDLTTIHLYNGGDDIVDIDCVVDFFGDDDWIKIEYFRPYLFPVSSMTEEQERELNSITNGDRMIYSDVFDFFNKNHIDYRMLIDRGLALDATDKNIY
jgi:hypothetical protein